MSKESHHHGVLESVRLRDPQVGVRLHYHHSVQGRRQRRGLTTLGIHGPPSSSPSLVGHPAHKSPWVWGHAIELSPAEVEPRVFLPKPFQHDLLLCLLQGQGVQLHQRASGEQPSVNSRRAIIQHTPHTHTHTHTRSTCTTGQAHRPTSVCPFIAAGHTSPFRIF